VTLGTVSPIAECKSCSRAAAMHRHLAKARLLLELLAESERLRTERLDAALAAIAKELAAA
jgi:hypothetical protein